MQVGGIEPVGLIRFVHCPANNTTSINVDMKMHIILNILSYVGDVLGSIQNSVQLHMALQLPVVALLLPSADNSDMLDANMFPSLQ